MAGIRQTFDKHGNPHPNWRYWYVDWQGKRVWETGSDDPKRTLAIAESLDLRDDEIRRQIEMGVRQPPKASDISKSAAAEEIIAEYLSWGKSQGGRGGRAWSRIHAAMRQTHLKFWRTRLGLKTLADFEGLLPRVEKVLRELQTKGSEKKKIPLSGKSLMNYTESIHAFCLWAKSRGYLSSDPLEGFAGFDITPKTIRRAMTESEIHKLLEWCAPHRRLLYEVAFCTGLRANELRQLTVDHLDVERSGLRLDAAWTKARKIGFQPLPAALAARLAEFAVRGDAQKLYTSFAWGSKSGDEKRYIPLPKNPLLYVPSNPARDLDKDLIVANLSKTGPGGKVDFHACRVAYTTFLFESGASLPEAQKLARHADPKLTANIYARVRDVRLQEVSESVGKIVLQDDVRGEKCAIRVQRIAAGAEGFVQPIDKQGGCTNPNEWRRRESKPIP